MPVKFNQYWTIISEQREEYGKFIIKEFIPGINSLGIHVVAGWSVLVGGYSEMFVESMSSDLDLIEKALKNPKFKVLRDNLFHYVKAYKTKILIPSGDKNSYTTDIKEDTIKFNQMWDIISKSKAEYEDYVINEYYPLLEKSNITVAGEWEVLLGDGPHIICEGRVRDTEKLIKTIQSKKFRTARRKLKGFVENFESRILSFHIQKIKGYKSSSYRMLEV
jgi:roadblock/LC7 domain-containing protein